MRPVAKVFGRIPFLKRFVSDNEQPKGFLHFDFERTFPHIFWTSNWVETGGMPEGFRYKILSMRTEPEGVVEVAAIREMRDGTKFEEIRATKPHGDSDDLNEIAEMIANDFGVRFDRVDMSQVRTFEEFATRSKEIGWAVSEE